MPHCIIEHSANIAADDLLTSVFTGALNSNLFEPDGGDIKVRTLAYDNCTVGGKSANFVHVMLRILSGRDHEQKQHLSQSVISELKQLALPACSITLEVVDIDRESYAKVLF